MWSLAQVNPDHLAEIHLSGGRFPQNYALGGLEPELSVVLRAEPVLCDLALVVGLVEEPPSRAAGDVREVSVENLTAGGQARSVTEILSGWTSTKLWNPLEPVSALSSLAQSMSNRRRNRLPSAGISMTLYAFHPDIRSST